MAASRSKKAPEPEFDEPTDPAKPESKSNPPVGGTEIEGVEGGPTGWLPPIDPANPSAMRDAHAAPPKFSRYVRSVEGRLVSRWGESGLFGAIRTVDKVTGITLAWDTKRVTGLTQDYCDRFNKELRRAFANGDLVECTTADYLDWLKLAGEREAEHDKRVAARKAERKKSAKAETPAPTETENS